MLHIRTHAGEKPYHEIEKKRPKRIRRKKPKSPQPSIVDHSPVIAIPAYKALGCMTVVKKIEQKNLKLQKIFSLFNVFNMILFTIYYKFIQDYHTYYKIYQK